MNSNESIIWAFQINRKEGQKGQSPVPPSADEPVSVAAGGYFGTYVDTDATARNEYELIRRYRDMSLHPEVDSAVDEIVNEFVVSDANDSCVEVELNNLEVGAGVKKKIRDEFDRIKQMLNFDNRAHEIVRSWYIDGRLFYHKVIDLDNPKKGILELRYIDPLKIRKVRQKLGKDSSQDPRINRAIKGTALEYEWGSYIDYYLFNPKGYLRGGALGPVGDMSNSQGIKIAADAIAFCSSGVQDLNKRMHLSFLHKGIKSLNQLRMIEDALVIYRLSRAPERRIFYIDVGNLPKVKAEQYLRDVMARYRNKLVYDATSGEIRDDKKHMSMLEDFGCLAERVDVVLRLLLYLADRTLANSRMWSILKRNSTILSIFLPLVSQTIIKDSTSVRPLKSSVTNLSSRSSLVVSVKDSVNSSTIFSRLNSSSKE